MAEDIGLFEAINTQRALRYLKPDPVPDELVKRVIDAGIRAPNGGNEQRWAFVVIKDPEIKRRMAPLLRRRRPARPWPRRVNLSPACNRLLRLPRRARRRGARLGPRLHPEPRHGYQQRRIHLPRRPEHAAGRQGPGPRQRPHHPRPPRLRIRNQTMARHSGRLGHRRHDPTRLAPRRPPLRAHHAPSRLGR